MKDRVILVTGAARGLGRSSAERLLDEGARVHVVHRSEAHVGELRSRFGRERVHQADLRTGSGCESVIHGVLGVDGRLDGIVHAVGEFHAAAPSEEGAGIHQALLESNLHSAVHLLGAARSALREARGSAVFFGMAGLESVRARASTAAYTAAKTALLVWMRSAAQEEARHGVRLNMVSPGVVPHEHAAPEAHADGWETRIPMGRTGRPEEVSAAVQFLLSEASSYVVGQNLEVAGGWLLGSKG